MSLAGRPPLRSGGVFCCIFPILYCKNNKKSKKTKKNAKKVKKICTYQKKVVPLHQISKQGDRKHQKLTPKSYKIMKTKVNKQNVIARIIKGGFNPKDAEKMVAKFWDLAESRGCKTTRDYYQEITWFWAVA